MKSIDGAPVYNIGLNICQSSFNHWIELDVYVEAQTETEVLLWPPYVIGGHYIFALWFLSIFFSFFFPRLISAAAGWMSTML